MRMKERASISKSSDGESKSDHHAAIKRPQNLATRFRGDHKEWQRHIQFCFSPHATLEFKTFLEFRQTVTMTDGDFSCLCCARHRLAFRASAGLNWRSLAPVQSASS